ncbi:MAG: hypothetical protein OXT64_02155 [Gammaproteobacteria bacterium]|nr:hypothetical protein [Gammaproteobacteria bacterium]
MMNIAAGSSTSAGERIKAAAQNLRQRRTEYLGSLLAAYMKAPVRALAHALDKPRERQCRLNVYPFALHSNQPRFPEPPGAVDG